MSSPIQNRIDDDLINKSFGSSMDIIRNVYHNLDAIRELNNSDIKKLIPHIDILKQSVEANKDLKPIVDNLNTILNTLNIANEVKTINNGVQESIKNFKNLLATSNAELTNKEVKLNELVSKSENTVNTIAPHIQEISSVNNKLSDIEVTANNIESISRLSNYVGKANDKVLNAIVDNLQVITKVYDNLDSIKAVVDSGSIDRITEILKQLENHLNTFKDVEQKVQVFIDDINKSIDEFSDIYKFNVEKFEGQVKDSIKTVDATLLKVLDTYDNCKTEYDKCVAIYDEIDKYLTLVKSYVSLATHSIEEATDKALQELESAKNSIKKELRRKVDIVLDSFDKEIQDYIKDLLDKIIAEIDKVSKDKLDEFAQQAEQKLDEILHNILQGLDKERIMVFSGSVETVDDLPQTGKLGEVYDVKSTNVNYVWDGKKWDAFGGETGSKLEYIGDKNLLDPLTMKTGVMYLYTADPVKVEENVQIKVGMPNPDTMKPTELWIHLLGNALKDPTIKPDYADGRIPAYIRNGTPNFTAEMKEDELWIDKVRNALYDPTKFKTLGD